MSARLALCLLCCSCVPKRAHVDIGDTHRLHVTIVGPERAVPLVHRALVDEAGNDFALSFEAARQPDEVEVHVKIAHAATRGLVDTYGKGAHAAGLMLLVTVTDVEGAVVMDREKFQTTERSYANADAAISAAAHELAEDLFTTIRPFAH